MKRAPVLAILADGIGYHGALIGVDAAEPRVLADAGSSATTLASAIADLARRLPGADGPPPTRAVVLSWQVHAALLALPVDPRRPLPPAQMRELVRWELETVAASARARRIGAILVGRGYLAAGERDRLLAALESPLVGGSAPRRFGDAAIAEGLITAAQLAECLALQQDVHDPAAVLACGWRALRARAGEGQWRWLAAGTPEALRVTAAAACAAAGMRLLGLLPAAGCARPSGTGIQAVLDHQRGLLCRVRWDGGEPADLRQSVLPTDEPLDVALSLIDPDAEQVWLVGAWDDTARAGVTALGRPTAPLAAGPLAGMAWAAQAALDPAIALAVVPARDPRQRWWRRPARLATAACLVVTLAALGLAGDLHHRTALMNVALGEDHAHRADLRSAEARQAELEEAEQLVREIEHDLPLRQQAAVAAIAALAEICPAEVQLDRVRITDGDGLEVVGWGASAAAVQVFRNAAQERFPTLALADAGLTARRESGSGSQPRYTFQLRLGGAKR